MFLFIDIIVTLCHICHCKRQLHYDRVSAKKIDDDDHNNNNNYNNDDVNDDGNIKKMLMIMMYNKLKSAYHPSSSVLPLSLIPHFSTYNSDNKQQHQHHTWMES